MTVSLAIPALTQVSPSNQFREAPLVGNPFSGFYTTVATADFNRDGKPDLLVINGHNSSQSLAVLLGNNLNQYVTKTVSDSASEPLGDAPQVADVNGDGILDIVTASQGLTDGSGNFTSEGAIDIYLGKGDGTFQNHSRVAVGQYSSPFLIDINHDGKTDLVVGTYPGGTTTQSGVQAFLNDGHGSLTAATPLILYSGGAATAIVAAGDITHSGAIDLIAGPVAGQVNEASGQSFQIVIGATNGTFRAGSILPYSLNPSFSFRSPVADYNGDGYPDFPLLNFANNSIVMLLGSKAGTLSNAQTVYIPGNDNYGNLATGDFNGDGKHDLAYMTGDPDNVVGVYPGLGNGKLADPRFYAQRRDFGGLLAGDFNKDGKTDLIAGSATLLLNDSKGFFPGPVLTLTLPDIPDNFVAGDFNHDGIPDVAVNTCQGRVRVFTGTGLGYYNPPVSYPVAAQNGLIAAGDVNNDGIPDLVVVGTGNYDTNCAVNSPNPKLSVLLGKPDGTFAPALNQDWIFHGPGGPQYSRSAFLADMNKDGKLDLVGLWGVALGNGNGTFSTPPTSLLLAEGSTVENLDVADFNRDGAPDIAVCVSQSSGNPQVISEYVRILQNDGHGNLSVRTDVKLPGIVTAAKGIDLNLDGRLDLVIAALTSENSPAASGLWIARGNGDGTFAAPALSYSSSTLNLSVDIESADFDRDGIPDVIASGFLQTASSGAAYFRGAGGGTLQAPAFYEMPLSNSQLLVTDVDGSGGPDVLALAGIGFTRLINTGRR